MNLAPIRTTAFNDFVLELDFIHYSFNTLQLNFIRYS